MKERPEKHVKKGHASHATSSPVAPSKNLQNAECRPQTSRPADQTQELRDTPLRAQAHGGGYIYIYIYNWGAGSRALVPPVSEIPGPGVWEESGRVLEAELLMEALGPQNY